MGASNHHQGLDLLPVGQALDDVRRAAGAVAAAEPVRAAAGSATRSPGSLRVGDGTAVRPRDRYPTFSHILSEVPAGHGGRLGAGVSAGSGMGMAEVCSAAPVAEPRGATHSCLVDALR